MQKAIGGGEILVTGFASGGTIYLEVTHREIPERVEPLIATASDAMTVSCPSCAARPGEPCRQGDRRRAPHATRRGRAEMFLSWYRPGPSPADMAMRRKRHLARYGRK
jgi:hypothetical protein